jgi:hypothetical protein
VERRKILEICTIKKYMLLRDSKIVARGRKQKAYLLK